ncbi:MAG: hypothetical protein D4S01_08000 [Dehalococcoidia bacterium]|nr:MAG: hypothetical protein D4S01_08000 [Dehalococcoidia bacterium]
MREQRTALILLLILCLAVVSISEIGMVKAEYAVYIRADGTVEGTDKIRRDGNVYTFLGNINGSIFVEKDSIVVDGAGYTLEDQKRGIVLSERNNVTVKNVKIEMEGGYGIYLVGASNCTILKNEISGSDQPISIKLSESFDNTIEGNIITNSFRGITIYRSHDNIITGNIVTDSVVGIELHDCYNNMLRNNQMNNNRSNFSVRQYPSYRYDNDVDSSNTVNGIPIYYWVNEKDKTVPSDPGYLALINCTRITVQNLNLPRILGILLVHTTDSTIKNNTKISITLIHSSNNSITENNVQNSSAGIQLQESSNNTISRNYIAYNDRGIQPLYSSVNNTIYKNEIVGNLYGIQESAGSNQIFRNNITANDYGINLGSSNNIISENNITANANVGILIHGGSNTLTGNTIIDNGDGIYLGASNNILRNNHMENNENNFNAERGRANDVDTSNTVEGKPIIYWVNQQDKTVPSDAGYVALINCKNITVKQLTFSYNGEGILLAYTTNSIITQCTLENMGIRVRFYGSSNNQIIGNNITNNDYGIYFSGGGFLSTYYPSSNNIFYHNNIVNNQRAVYDIADEDSPWVPVSSPPINIWDNGYAAGGKYWGYYMVVDNDGDGIRDIPIIINENNRDNYPLMAPVQNTNQYTFSAGTWERKDYYVDITSNSTVTNFQFTPSEGAFIRFKAEGESGTTGFCRINLPKGLIQTEETWVILVDENPVIPTVNEDSINTYLYFTYPHSEKNIEIRGTTVIPEFPSWTPLLIMLVAVVAVAFIYRRSLHKHDRGRRNQ